MPWWYIANINPTSVQKQGDSDVEDYLDDIEWIQSDNNSKKVNDLHSMFNDESIKS